MNIPTELIIQKAISDIKAGKKESARKALSKVVQQEHNNAHAWYLLSQVLDKQEHAVYCLEAVLKIQPDNQQAKERLARLANVSIPTQEQPPSTKATKNNIESTTTEKDINALTVDSPTKKCPYCAEIIKAEATYCRFCKNDLRARSPRKIHKKPRKISIVSLGLLAAAMCLLCYVIGVFSDIPKIKNYISNNGAPFIDSRTWIVYEVTYSGFNIIGQSRGNVDMTWENNTGGTEQGTFGIGDGQSHTYTYGNGEELTSKYPPFRRAYTMKPGDFAYISAQSNKYDNQLRCNIYLADNAGVNCIIEQGIRCGTIDLWKTAQCSGEFCICTASGIVGHD